MANRAQIDAWEREAEKLSRSGEDDERLLWLEERIAETFDDSQDDVRYAKRLAIFAALCILGTVAIWVFSSKMEAQAYNRQTGANVSTWDAMWVELRVQAGPQGSK